MSQRIITSIVLLFLIPFLGIFCSSNKKPMNVLLITVDTLRPDHLGYGGHFRNLSPNIDKFARESIVFTNAYSQSGWTLPSVATILTGKYPKDHGAVDFHVKLNNALPTMASILKEHGYDTRGYVSHLLLTPTYGLEKGFNRFDFSVLNQGDPHKISTSRQLTDLVLGDIRIAKEPFFIWAHYFDPHFAYMGHQGWDAYGEAPIDRYDQEIGYTDFYIGKLLEYLERKGLNDRTIIIFTADHGEEFGDHGGRFHYTCFNEILRVPAIIKAPFLKPQIDNRPVEQIDFLPTLMAMLNIPITGDYPGHNLLQAGERNQPIFIERERPPGYLQHTVIYEGYKLINIEPTDTMLIPESSRVTYPGLENVILGSHLFNLNNDPKEMTNLLTTQASESEKLKALLASHFTGQAQTEERIQIDEALQEKLRKLGYLK